MAIHALGGFGCHLRVLAVGGGDGAYTEGGGSGYIKVWSMVTNVILAFLWLT